MSGVYPYCVVRAGCHPPAGLKGLSDHLVEGRDIGPFTVWASPEPGPPRLDLEGISRHHAVVRAASDSGTPLPVRFGAWAPDHEALVRRIERHRGELEAALAAVQGRAEFGLTIEDDGAATLETARSGKAPEDGRAYMRELSRHYAGRRRYKERRDAVLESLRETLAELGLDERVRRLSPPGLLSVAHLVARSHEARYRALVEGFVREHARGIRVHLSGPWPPYSFVSS
jgi:hypothetical protein